MQQQSLQETSNQAQAEGDTTNANSETIPEVIDPATTGEDLSDTGSQGAVPAQTGTSETSQPVADTINVDPENKPQAEPTLETLTASSGTSVTAAEVSEAYATCTTTCELKCNVETWDKRDSCVELCYL